MRPILIKVYGNFYPAEKLIAHNLRQICARDYGSAEGAESVSLEHDLLLISFEGIFFPIEDVTVELNKWLTECARQGIKIKGKLDVLDLEKWTLTRFLPENGELIWKKVPLNNVLDYSGH